MKGTRTTIAAVLWCASAAGAMAQTAPASPPPPPVVRPDISGTVGWLNVNKGNLSPYNNWYNRSAHGAVTFGWYWSTHLKTEIEAAASTRADLLAIREELINGFRAHVHSEYGFSTRRLTLSQAYQFDENAWFHPHLAAGLDFNWERVRRIDRSVYFWDVNARLNSLVRNGVTHPTRTDLHVRPFASAGFKAYMTRRSFFRSDLRFVAGDRLEEVLLRFGFGTDF
jgi:hypothetical protein